MDENTATAERFPQLMTIAEAARAARVSVPTLYRRVATGEVPAIRVGEHGPIRVPREEFRAWLFESEGGCRGR